jgi:hypothetical protein
MSRDQKVRQEREVSSQLLSSLDRALDEYGASVKQVVYWNFERTYGYERSEIFNHPEEFVKTLNTIFGGGAAIVERKISAQIKATRGFTRDYSDLSELFKAARLGVKDSHLENTIIA